MTAYAGGATGVDATSGRSIVSAPQRHVSLAPCRHTLGQPLQLGLSWLSGGGDRRRPRKFCNGRWRPGRYRRISSSSLVNAPRAPPGSPLGWCWCWCFTPPELARARQADSDRPKMAPSAVQQPGGAGPRAIRQRINASCGSVPGPALLAPAASLCRSRARSESTRACSRRWSRLHARRSCTLPLFVNSWQAGPVLSPGLRPAVRRPVVRTAVSPSGWGRPGSAPGGLRTLRSAQRTRGLVSYALRGEFI